MVAGCGLAYELVISTASSFFLGDTVLQFSLTIGIFMSALGLGAALSRRIERDLLYVFVLVEVAVAAVGGFSAALIFAAYGWSSTVRAVTLVLPALVGCFVGLELPLLVRILTRQSSFKDSLAHALSFDYLGGLLASLAFPLVLLPQLGVVRSALAFGVLNAGVAFITAVVFARHSPRLRKLRVAAAAVFVLVLGAFSVAGVFTRAVEGRLDGGTVVASFQTTYQHVLLTRRHDETRLLLDGHLQLSSLDEARYHESLAHPAMGASPGVEQVLIIGGGDGQLAREILRHQGVMKLTLVDIDDRLVEFCRTEPLLTDLNEGVLDDPRVSLVAADGFTWLEARTERFDRIFLDLPDPRSEAVARLYSVEFFRVCRDHLNRGGVLATQAGSPYYAPRAFWCVVSSMEAAGLQVAAAHVNVPSFGEWGFAFGSELNLDPSSSVLPAGLSFLTAAGLEALFAWPVDLQRPPPQVSTIDRPRVMHFHREDWQRWVGTPKGSS